MRRAVRLELGRRSAVSDFFNVATFDVSIFGDRAGSLASRFVELAMNHPVVTFQVFALLSILMHRRRSQI